MNRDRDLTKIKRKNIMWGIGFGVCIWAGINTGAAIVEKGIPHLAYLLGPIPFAVIGGIASYYISKERNTQKQE